MGTVARVRHEPRRAGSRALVGALGLGLASGCGSTVSLDQPPSEASGSSTTTAAASTEAPGSAAVDSGPASTGAPSPDVPATDLPPPPPELCPAGCTVDLPVVWTWESEPLRNEPPDDGIRPTGRHLAAMVRTLDGSFVVAENRGPEPWLTRVAPHGALLWSTYFDLACDCTIVEIALTPIGDLLVLGEGAFNDQLTYLSLFYTWIADDDLIPFWVALDVAWGSEERPARVGSILPFGTDSAAVVVAESGLEGDALDKDWFELYYYVAGVQEGSWLVDTQLATAPPRRPRGVALSRGELAVTLPGGVGVGDYVAWLPPLSGFVSAIEPTPGPIDAIAAGPDLAVVVAGIERPVGAPPVLRMAGLPHTEPTAWTHDVEVPADAGGVPVLAVDTAGSTYAALRIIDAASREPAVWLARLHPDGSPAWSTTVPLPASESPTPVALSLAEDDEDLVLAAIVDERLHLERREQGCRCD